MCSMYWNLMTMITCPKCKKRSKWELQTHFMGDYGSCVNCYRLREKIAELGETSARLDGKNDSFIGDCPKCYERKLKRNNYISKYYDFGADIVKGKVMKVWLLEV
jgi:ssDNA-binding Zn-finger/Zn-ribbon topoisomerase 1